LLAQNASNTAPAEHSPRTAIEIARKQHAKSWEVRATTSLACLLAKKGKRDEVGAMFAGIYNWFTERFDTRRPERSEGAARRIGPLAG
jgi:hypothetical protein